MWKLRGSETREVELQISLVKKVAMVRIAIERPGPGLIDKRANCLMKQSKRFLYCSV